MRRIDYLLNAKDPIKVLVEEFDLDLKCYRCNHYKGCDVCDTDCDEAFIEYLEEDIEVNESNFKVADTKSIGQVLQSIHDVPPQIKINSDKIKEVNTKETLQETLDEVKEPVENEFMEEISMLFDNPAFIILSNNVLSLSIPISFSGFGIVFIFLL